MIWLLAIGAYLVVALTLSYFLGPLLRRAGDAYPEVVRCTCRRHGFPSPLCPVHGRKA